MTLLLQSGKTSTLQLASHVFVDRIQDLPPVEIMEVIQKCIALSRFKDAWHYSLQVGTVIDVWEGTSGTAADVPRFGLEIHLVSNAILDEQIFINKFCEIEDLSLFTDRFLAK